MFPSYSFYIALSNGPFSNAQQMNYTLTRELPGVALVNISNGLIFTGKGNTHLKWNIEVAHVEEKKYLNDAQFSVK